MFLWATSPDSTGGTIDFTLPTHGTISTLSALLWPCGGANGLNSLPVATVNGGSTWALATGPGTIGALTSYSSTNSFANNTLGATLITSSTSSESSDGYSGGTQVEAGTLEVTSVSALPTGTSLTVGAGGAFIFDPSLAPSANVVSPSAVAVPEPPASALLGVGAIGLVGWTWRRRRRPSS